MATVDSPTIGPDGMVICKDCPLDKSYCIAYLGFSDGKMCPSPGTYQEAVELAEQEAAK